MKVSTDQAKIDRLLKRHVVETIVEKDLRRRLASGQRLRIKQGFDPTAPDLHLGHAVSLWKLREFQDLGHQVILLIGDYTARVGDPSGRSKTRPMLTAKEVDANAKTYLDQAGKILDLKKVELRRNSEWFGRMGFDDILKLTAQFTVARMIERDDFERRLKEGTDIHMHELLYPMMQAFDSVELKADVEVGATDQRFNILAGRDLQRKLGMEPQEVMLLGPILVGTDGKQKMSKSLGNYVGVTDAPEEMCGKAMSIPDDVLWEWFSLTTEVPDEEIAELKQSCQQGKMNPRDAKMRLAKEIITLYHGADAAAAAEKSFCKVFKEKGVPDEVPEIRVKAGEHSLVDLLLQAELVDSKNEARRVIGQKGVRVAGKIVDDVDATVAIGAEPVLLQKGKRHFLRFVGK